MGRSAAISVVFVLCFFAMFKARAQDSAEEGKAADRWLPLQVKAREVL